MVILSEKEKVVTKIEEVKKSNQGPLIGMATRVAAEKGIDIVVKSIKKLRGDFPNLKLLIAGDKNAIGEEKYWVYLNNLIKKLKVKVIFLGRLDQSEMRFFYRMIDVLVVASTNSTEAFGMVQVEAMLEGTPVVATDLPGVRIPVKITGMGEIVNVNDKGDLHQKIFMVFKKIDDYKKSKTDLEAVFSTEVILDKYLKLYKELRI